VRRWEYRQIHLERFHDGVEAHLYDETGEHSILSQQDSVALLNDMGWEGWELVHIETFNGVFRDDRGWNVMANWVDRRFWFKRLAPS
jgi:hypothetical protein